MINEIEKLLLRELDRMTNAISKKMPYYPIYGAKGGVDPIDAVLAYEPIMNSVLGLLKNDPQSSN